MAFNRMSYIVETEIKEANFKAEDMEDKIYQDFKYLCYKIDS